MVRKRGGRKAILTPAHPEASGRYSEGFLTESGKLYIKFTWKICLQRRIAVFSCFVVVTSELHEQAWT